MAIKKCKYCGKEFESRGTMRYCPGPHYAICEICGKEFEVDPRYLRSTCSKQCTQLLIQQSMKIKECEICGKEFHPKSSMSRYCEGPHYSTCPVCHKQFEIKDVSKIGSCCSEKCRSIKRQRTNIDKYGVNVAAKTEEVKDKLRKTWKESTEEKKKQTCLERYGYENSSQSPDVKKKISSSLYGRKKNKN